MVADASGSNLTCVSQGASTHADVEMTAVRRAFDTAYRRMLECTVPDELPDELSNMLHHLYRLGELRKRRWRATIPDFVNRDFGPRVTQVPGALGALWIRCYDTHEIAILSEMRDVYPSVYPAIYGVLVWKPTEAMSFINPPEDRGAYTDYNEHLANKVAFDTLRAAFDGLAVLP